MTHKVLLALASVILPLSACSSASAKPEHVFSAPAHCDELPAMSDRNGFLTTVDCQDVDDAPGLEEFTAVYKRVAALNDTGDPANAAWHAVDVLVLDGVDKMQPNGSSVRFRYSPESAVANICATVNGGFDLNAVSEARLSATEQCLDVIH